ADADEEPQVDATSWSPSPRAGAGGRAMPARGGAGRHGQVRRSSWRHPDGAPPHSEPPLPGGGGGPGGRPPDAPWAPEETEEEGPWSPAQARRSSWRHRGRAPPSNEPPLPGGARGPRVVPSASPRPTKRRSASAAWASLVQPGPPDEPWAPAEETEEDELGHAIGREDRRGAGPARLRGLGAQAGVLQAENVALQQDARRHPVELSAARTPSPRRSARSGLGTASPRVAPWTDGALEEELLRLEGRMDAFEEQLAGGALGTARQARHAGVQEQLSGSALGTRHQARHADLRQEGLPPTARRRRRPWPPPPPWGAPGPAPEPPWAPPEQDSAFFSELEGSPMPTPEQLARERQYQHQRSFKEVEVDEVTVASLVLVDVGASDQDSYSRFDGMASSCTTFTLPTNVSGKSGKSLPSNGSRAVSWQKRRSLMMMHSVSLDSTRSSQLPCKVDKAKVAAFQASLRLAGLNTSQWGQNGSNTVEHLYWEAYHQQGCLLTGLKVMGKLKRITHLVKIRLFANIMGEESELFTRLQLLHDGRCKEREQVLVRRLRWTSVDLDCEDKVDESFYAPDCPHTEAWREGVENALAERLGLPASWQREHLREEVGAVSTFEVEDDVRSGTYPGLPTMFCIHTTTLRVVDVESPAVQRLGLPTGQEFATTEGQFTFGRQDEEGPRIGSQLNIWTWRRQRTPVGTTASAGPQEAGEPDLAPKETNRASSFNSLEARLSAVVPLPMTRCAREGPSRPCPPGSSPNAALWRIREGNGQRTGAGSPASRSGSRTPTTR
ncbi:unnamed protein product, partial [Prorocentrum cordatum]